MSLAFLTSKMTDWYLDRICHLILFGLSHSLSSCSVYSHASSLLQLPCQEFTWASRSAPPQNGDMLGLVVLVEAGAVSVSETHPSLKQQINKCPQIKR